MYKSGAGKWCWVTVSLISRPSRWPPAHGFIFSLRCLPIAIAKFIFLPLNVVNTIIQVDVCILSTISILKQRFWKVFFLLGTEKSTLYCNHLKSARTLVEMANIDDTVELRLQTVMIARVVLVLLRRMIKSANFYRVYEGIGRPRVARGLMTTNKVNLRRRKDEDNKTNNLEYI